MFHTEEADYWFTPEERIHEEIMPKKGVEFKSHSEVVKMYRKYAYEAGFDVRQGKIKRDFMVLLQNDRICNRQGKSNTSQVDTLDIQKQKRKKRTDLHRTECNARIVFKIIPGTLKYMVHEFREIDNHN